MTPEEAKRFVPLIQALADGKTIQWINGAEWKTLNSPDFLDKPENYRVKPEPREFVIFVDTDGYILHKGPRDSDLPQSCGYTGSTEAIRVREVLD